jgi:hypothetical protein
MIPHITPRSFSHIFSMYFSQFLLLDTTIHSGLLTTQLHKIINTKINSKINSKISKVNSKKSHVLYLLAGRGSSDGIATGYGLDGPGI